LDFYVSWSHSDALYSDYFESCPLLISAISRNTYSLKRFKKVPLKLIIDSGAVFYAKKNLKYKVKDIFEEQLKLAMPLLNKCPITLVHADEPLLNKKTVSEKFDAVQKTIVNAQEYMNLAKRNSIVQENKLSIMGVIQGYDLPSLRFSIFELQKLGYVKFGIGSLLGKSVDVQIELIKFASELVGAENLHVFGVTGIPQIKEMKNMKIASFDSSRPTKAAIYHQVFYSDPFQTFVIDQSKIDKRQGQRLDAPLACDCPICKINQNDIFNISHRKYTLLRSIHNYYHFSKTINRIIHEEVTSDVISNVLRS